MMQAQADRALPNARLAAASIAFGAASFRIASIT